MSKLTTSLKFRFRFRYLRLIWVLEQAREPIFGLSITNFGTWKFLIICIVKIFGPDFKCHYHVEKYNQLATPIQIRGLRVIWVIEQTREPILDYPSQRFGTWKFVIVSILNILGLNLKCHYHVETYNQPPIPIQNRNPRVIWVLKQAREPIFGLSITKIWNLEVCNNFYCKHPWS